MGEGEMMAGPDGSSNGWERWRGETAARLCGIEDKADAIFEKLDGLNEWKSTVETRLAKVALIFGLLGGAAALAGELVLRVFAK